MAPNKFEKHIKKELEEREIQPSSKAWEQLSEKMDATAPQSRKKGYLWYGIAASFVGLIILSVVFFNAKEPILETNTTVVEEDNEVIKELIDLPIIETQKTNVEVVATEKLPVLKEKEKTGKTNLEIVEKKPLIEQLVTVSNDAQVPLIGSSEEIINTKVLEVLAQVDILEQDHEVITDAEVDSLLRMAQQELLTDRLFRTDRSVDAMALLAEVEGELDETFRDQIFESLKTGFLKVRTAVADRNN